MQGKSLVFLGYILNCTQEDLETTNALIQLAAGEHLPAGAEVVIAECIADPAVAEKFNELTQKRAKRHNRPETWIKGKTRAEIKEATRIKREAAEAARKRRRRKRRTAPKQQ